MDPYAPPKTSTRLPRPPQGKWVNFVALAAWGLLLTLLTSRYHWWVGILAFLFSFAALHIARGRAQRILGVLLSGISGAACVIGILAAVRGMK